MKISIALATYNGTRYLREQLDSFVAQSRPPDELVITDDNSTDDTISIIKSFASQAPFEIRYSVNEKNIGYTANFERAIQQCTGDLIFLSDQDDIWLPEHLSVLLKHLKNTNCSLVGGNALLVDSYNKDLNCKLINNNNLPSNTEDFNTMVLYRNVFQGASILFEKDILVKALPFPDSMKYHDWWLALVASELKGVNYINIPILRYRQHENNASGAHKKDSFKERVLKFFNSDITENSTKLFSVLEPFYNISSNKQNVKLALEYARNCKERKFSGLLNFNKYYKKIYFNESYFMFLVRKIKMLLNIIF